MMFNSFAYVLLLFCFQNFRLFFIFLQNEGSNQFETKFAKKTLVPRIYVHRVKITILKENKVAHSGDKPLIENNRGRLSIKLISSSIWERKNTDTDYFHQLDSKPMRIPIMIEIPISVKYRFPIGGLGGRDTNWKISFFWSIFFLSLPLYIYWQLKSNSRYEGRWKFGCELDTHIKNKPLRSPPYSSLISSKFSSCNPPQPFQPWHQQTYYLDVPLNFCCMLTQLMCTHSHCPWWIQCAERFF